MLFGSSTTKAPPETRRRPPKRLSSSVVDPGHNHPVKSAAPTPRQWPLLPAASPGIRLASGINQRYLWVLSGPEDLVEHRTARRQPLSACSNRRDTSRTLRPSNRPSSAEAIAMAPGSIPSSRAYLHRVLLPSYDLVPLDRQQHIQCGAVRVTDLRSIGGGDQPELVRAIRHVGVLGIGDAYDVTVRGDATQGFGKHHVVVSGTIRAPLRLRAKLRNKVSAIRLQSTRRPRLIDQSGTDRVPGPLAQERLRRGCIREVQCEADKHSPPLYWQVLASVSQWSVVARLFIFGFSDDPATERRVSRLLGCEYLLQEEALLVASSGSVV